MDWTIVLIVLQLIFLEGILSIDNAAVLGAMVTHLPDDKAIEWPHALKRLGIRLHGVLGNQRTAALRVGLLGAYVGRGLMLFLASLIVQNPWLKIIGAIYLIRLAFENLGHVTESSDEEDMELRPMKTNGFWSIVLTIELTDLIFSLDNVVAAVSLSDQLWVVMLGVAIGILFMRFAAGWFSYAVEREPILKVAAYLLVLNIGVELLLSEIWHIEIHDFLRFGISIATIALTLAYAHIKPLHVFRPVLVWVSRGFTALDELINWALTPFIEILKLIGKAFMLLFRKPKTS